MEWSQVWFPVAILVGVGLIVAMFLFVRTLLTTRIPATSPEEREELAHLPMTPLQKRAWVGLLIGLAMTTAIVVVIARVGPVAYFDDDDLRLVVLGLLMTTLASYLVVVVPTGLTAVSKGAPDERDERVLAIAPHIQVAAILVTVASWSAVLTEVYRGEGIPTGFMYLLFWSVFLAYMLAHSAGILFGYWFARDHA
jgi:hypothetical protein